MPRYVPQGVKEETMKEHELRALIEEVRSGAISRRSFVQRMVALGLTAPMASTMLMHSGVAQAQAASSYKATKRGGGGPLRVLWWQGATLLNPHFATGTKDQEGSRIFYEPLAAWDPDGDIVPVLAAEIPTAANGGLSKDGKSGDPEAEAQRHLARRQAVHCRRLCLQLGIRQGPRHRRRYREHLQRRGGQEDRLAHCRGHVFETHSVLGRSIRRHPRHVDSETPVRRLHRRQVARRARQPANPWARGRSKVRRLQTRRMCAASSTPTTTSRIVPFSHDRNEGRRCAVSAARAVIQIGEYDSPGTWQVKGEILKRLEFRRQRQTRSLRRQHRVHSTQSGRFVDRGSRRTANPKSKHPIFSDPAVRQAMVLLVDRKGVEDFVYGRTGVATGNFLNNPPRFRSANTKWEFNVDKANAVLEAAGWKKGADGVREKGGKKLKLVFQTSINAPRQKTQAIIKQACQKAGVDLELKSVTASVFFSSDVGNPDTYTKFWCDMQMYTTTMTQPDPELFMDQYVSWLMSSRENKWQGRNAVRWKSDEYDKAYRAAQAELDPVKRAALFIRMNDLVCMDNVIWLQNLLLTFTECDIIQCKIVSTTTRRIVGHDQLQC